MQLVMLHVSYVKSVMSHYAARLGYACSVPVSKPALQLRISDFGLPQARPRLYFVLLREDVLSRAPQAHVAHPAVIIHVISSQFKSTVLC